MFQSKPPLAVSRRARPTIVVAFAVVIAALMGVVVCWSLAAPPSSAGTTAFDDDVQAVARLDPDLLRALRQAASAAEDEGVELHVNSGWRSAAHQEHLLDEAVSTYGSREEAARWVATPETSPHVSGDAVDIGPSEAAMWLSERGAAYGLCRIYDNEPWHYELRPDAVDHGCPPTYADPTHDPRMQATR